MRFTVASRPCEASGRGATPLWRVERYVTRRVPEIHNGETSAYSASDNAPRT
jgi:hypothetical protein